MDPTSIDPPGTGPSPRSGGAIVRVAVAGVVLLVGAMMALIFVKAHRVPEPTSAIMVYGDPSLDDARIVVTPLGAASGQGAVEATLQESNRYQTPIYRFPGDYHVKVTWHGVTTVDADLRLERFRGAMINLPTVITLVGDASMSGDVVTVYNESVSGLSVRGAFGPANKYRLQVLEPPGKYVVQVTRDHVPVTEQSFAILPHTAKEIDLLKKT